MRMAVCAGAVALALMGPLFVSERGIGPAQASAQEITLTEGKISRLKHALHLTAEQLEHWRPVEAALRAALHARGDENNDGLVQRVRSKVRGYVVQAQSLQRAVSVAGPLIASLDETQRRNGQNAIRSMGVSASMF